MQNINSSLIKKAAFDEIRDSREDFTIISNQIIIQKAGICSWRQMSVKLLKLIVYSILWVLEP